MRKFFLIILGIGAAVWFGVLIMGEGKVAEKGQRPLEPPAGAMTGEVKLAFSGGEDDKFLGAQKKVMKESCINEARKNEEAKKSGMDIPGFCGCIVEAHANLDFTLKDTQQRQVDFYKKGKPCFEEYLKPVIAKSCAVARSVSGVNVDCKCMYKYSVQEHLKNWIQGTDGKSYGDLSDQEREKKKVDVGMNILKKCIQ